MTCPECSSRGVEIVDKDLRSYNGRVTVGKCCHDCKSEWLDIYDLVEWEMCNVRGKEV